MKTISIFSVTIVGLILNFLGTLVLVFSLPTCFTLDNKDGSVCLESGKFKVSDETITPSDACKSLKFAFNLFTLRVCKEKDLGIILALFLLGFGYILQGYGVLLSATDC